MAWRKRGCKILITQKCGNIFWGFFSGNLYVRKFYHWENLPEMVHSPKPLRFGCLNRFPEKRTRVRLDMRQKFCTGEALARSAQRSWDVPSLEEFKAKLDGALSYVVHWEMSLAGALELTPQDLSFYTFHVFVILRFFSVQL